MLINTREGRAAQEAAVRPAHLRASDSVKPLGGGGQAPAEFLTHLTMGRRVEAEARLEPLGNGLRRLFDLPLWRVFDTEAAEFVYLLRHIKFFVRDHNHRGDREL